SSTIDGVPGSTTALTSMIQGFNSPAFLVLFTNGTFGYLPTTPPPGTLPAVTTGFPVYGTVTPLSNGWLQLLGNNNVIPHGLTTSTVFVGGVIYPVNGQFYATLTYVGSSIFPEGFAGKSLMYGREVDVATFVLPLTVLTR